MATDRPAAALLRQLSAAFKLSRRRLQAELDAHGLHAGQDYLVEVLAREDGLTVGEIAERLAIEVPTVVRTVQRMEAGALVRRERDPQDRRRTRIVLTDRGRALEPVVRDALRSVSDDATKGFSAAERAQLLDLLTRVQRNLLAD